MLTGSRWLATAVLGGLGALSVGPAWAVPAARPQHAATTVAVVIAEDAFAPDPVTAFVGDTITWTNADDVPHDVYGAGGPSALRSPMLSAGESWSYVAAEVGSYSYVCTIHEAMVGAITVAEHEDAVPAEPVPVDPVPVEPVPVEPAPVGPVPVEPAPEAVAPRTDPGASPVAVAAAATARVAATVPEPRFRVELWLLGAALLTFAVVAVALAALSPGRDG